MSEQHLQTIQTYIDKMPSLSTTVTKVLQVCDQPNVSPNDLNKIISLDPVLAGNVLKLINSAYYSLPNHINSLTRAIIVLGINTVKNLALTTAVLGSIKNTRRCALSMDKFWSHSLCVGVTAKEFSKQCKVPMSQREEFFLSGLLHDLGKIPMAQCFPEEYAQCIALCRSREISLHEAEESVFGFNHQHCGSIIAHKWKLSDNIISVMESHHEVEKSNDDHKLLITCVAIANFYANIFAMGTIDEYSISEASIIELLEQSPLSWNNISGLHEVIHDSIERASLFIQMSQSRS